MNNQAAAVLCRVLDVPFEEIDEIYLLGGMTNKNWLLGTKSKGKYVVRLPGTATREFICWSNERANNLVASGIGISPEVVYLDPETGLKVTRYIPNAETLTPFTIHKHIQSVAELFAKLHATEPSMNNRFDFIVEFDRYRTMMAKRSLFLDSSLDCVLQALPRLLARLEDLGVDWRNAHCDPVAENFVLERSIEGESVKLFLVDWEYSGLMDPMWDVAALFFESRLSPESRGAFLKHYALEFGGLDVDVALEKILIYQILQNILWHTWTLVKEADGDDFGTYADDRRVACVRLFNEWSH